jgi:hypothetical protein
MAVDTVMYTGAIEIVTNVACHAHDISPLIFISTKARFYRVRGRERLRAT